MKWDNLYVPGALTTKEKQAQILPFYDNFPSKLRELNLDMQLGYRFKDEILTVYDNVAKYFIDRMEDVDSFKMKPNSTDQEITSLYFAAEADDIYIARLLLDKGANYNLRLGSTYYFDCKCSPTFIYRLIFFKSYKTLRMFLTDYKDKAKNIMNKGEDEITPLVFFILSFILYKNISVSDFKYYVSLFINCGSSLDKNTNQGCARFYLEDVLHIHI